MGSDLIAVPAAMDSMAAAAAGAGELVSAAGSFDGMATLASVVAAIGPIGAIFLGAYAPAQANNQAATMMLGALHTAIGATTEAAKTGYIAADSVH